MNIKHTISATALSAALLIGGGAAAFAGASGADGAGSATPAGSPRATALCEHQNEIIPYLTHRQAGITERINKLMELQSKAKGNSRDKLAERIGKRIDRLQRELDRVNKRLAKAPGWIAEHCS